MTFKALTGRSSNNITGLFSKCDNENYNLRSNNTKLSLTKPNTNFLKRSFSYRAAKSWNEGNSFTGKLHITRVQALLRDRTFAKIIRL